MQRYVDSMRRKVARWGCPILLLCATGLSAQISRTASAPSKSSQASPYLFLWAGDADAKNSDFLAVIDARSESKSYGKVIATVPINATGTMPHHTQYEFPSNAILFANGWAAGRTFLFTLDYPVHRESSGDWAVRQVTVFRTVSLNSQTGTCWLPSKARAGLTPQLAAWSNSMSGKRREIGKRCRRYSR